MPSEIQAAAQSGDLVVFVGAGLSRLIRCPSWDQFANSVLEQLVPLGIDHFELTQLRTIPDPKKRLSIAKIIASKRDLRIDYGAVLKGSRYPGDVYEHLNQFKCVFVTTNYEKHLSPTCVKAKPENAWRFYRSTDLLPANLDTTGNVLHLHGCIDDPEQMVITTKDYLAHYERAEVKAFLQYLFGAKTVLFLGYGLDEMEVLEYVLRRGGVGKRSSVAAPRRYALLGFFNSDGGMYELLRSYYLESFDTDIVAFSKHAKDYAQQGEILAEWARILMFSDMAITDQAAALLEEIRG